MSMENISKPLSGPTSIHEAAIQWMASQRAHALEWGIAAAGGAIWLATYWETLVSLSHRFGTDANYSHGYLVPLVSGYLLWHSLNRESLLEIPRVRGGSVTGAIVLLLALLSAAGSMLVPSLIVECASMLLSLAGLILILGGWSWWRHAWAPLLFLVFMVPWPSSLYSQAAFPLQLLVSRISSVLLSLGGITVMCEGNLIHLPGQTMHVAQACSGLRQLTAFLAMAACAAILVRRPLWYRGTLLASAVPIAVLVNVIRVTLTGLVTFYVGASWTEGVLHTLEGLMTIALGMGIMMAGIQLLDWLLVAPGAPNRGGGKGS